METTLNIETLETISVTTATRRKTTDGDLEITAKVTERNGKITTVDDIQVAQINDNNEEPECMILWQGYANPNISGSFHAPGREAEVMGLVSGFVNQLRSTVEND